MMIAINKVDNEVGARLIITMILVFNDLVIVVICAEYIIYAPIESCRTCRGSVIIGTYSLNICDRDDDGKVDEDDDHSYYDGDDCTAFHFDLSCMIDSDVNRKQ